MTRIDANQCAALLRTITDEIAGTCLPSAQDRPIAELVADVRELGRAAKAKMRSALFELDPTVVWTDEEDRPGDADYWLYDPIDGAYHYLQGLPLWAGSLVLVRSGQPVFSVVYEPALREIFVAYQDQGSTCNGHAMKVSAKSRLDAAVVGGAVPPLAQVGQEEQDEAIVLLTKVARSVFVVRPMAAASLQLAYVAAGRLDAYFETGCDAADWLAGTLLVREAGGVVTDLTGDRFGWTGHGILAGSQVIHRQLLSVTNIEPSRLSGTRGL